MLCNKEQENVAIKNESPRKLNSKDYLLRITFPVNESVNRYTMPDSFSKKTKSNSIQFLAITIGRENKYFGLSIQNAV